MLALHEWASGLKEVKDTICGKDCFFLFQAATRVNLFN